MRAFNAKEDYTLIHSTLGRELAHFEGDKVTGVSQSIKRHVEVQIETEREKLEALNTLLRALGRE